MNGYSHAIAVKQALTTEIERCMRREGLSKPRMARRMGASRSQLDRVLDPNCTTIPLEALVKAARAVGRKLEIRFHSRPPGR